MSIVASITVAWQNVRDEDIGGLKTIETDEASDNQGSPPTFTDLDGAITRAREVLDFARAGTNNYTIENASELARAHITLHPGSFVLTDATSTSDFQNSSTGNDDVFITTLPGARINDSSANFDIGDAENVVASLDALTRVLFDSGASTLSIFEELIVDDPSTFKGAATFENNVTVQSQANFQSTADFSGTITIQGSDVEEVTSSGSNSSSTALITAAGVDSKIPNTTDNLSEGSNNLYFTQSRTFQTLRDGDLNNDSDPNTNGVLQAGSDITFNVDDNNETITIDLDGDLGSVAPEVQSNGGTVTNNTSVFNFTDLISVSNPTSGEVDITVGSDVFDIGSDNSDDITEGSNNLFFTDSRVFSANQSQFVAGSNIDISEDAGNEEFTFSFTGTAGASVSADGSQVLAEPEDLNFGTDLEVIDDGDDTVTINFVGDISGASSDVEDDGTPIQTSASVLNFTNLLDASNPNADEVDISVNDDLSQYDNSTSGFISDISGFTTDDLSEGSNNRYFSEELAQDAVGTIMSGGSNTTVDYDDSNDTITITSTNTQLTDEEVQDAVYNNVLSGDQTLISVTYDDTNGEVDYVVNDDLSQYDNSTSGFIAGLDVDDNDSDVATGVDNLNFGTNLSVTDDTGGTVTIDAGGGSIEVQDSGTTSVAGVSTIDFQNLLDVTEPGGGESEVAVNDDLSQYDNSTSGFISGLDINDSGTDVNTGIVNLNFGSNISVTDDGGGTVTIDGSGSSDTRVNVSDDGTQVVTNADDINFTGEVEATSDGDGSATVDLENNTVTVAGNTVSLGSATSVSLTDLSDVGTDGTRPQFSDLPSIATTTTPSKDSDLATKVYVDGVAQGLDLKESVRAATNGTNVDLASTNDPNPIDGVTLSDGDRVLLKDQSFGSENGIYVADTATNPATWTRSSDADEDDEVTSGTFTFVEEGTENGDTSYIITTPDPVNVGSTSINWSQFSAAGKIAAGDGLSKDGQTLDVALPISDSGTGAGTGFDLNFGTNLTVTDDGSGAFTIDAAGGISGLDIDDGGSDVATGIDNLNFGTNLTVTDDGSGTVTIDGSGSSDTRTNVSDGGSQIVTNTDDIDFGANLSVTDDGDNSVTVDANIGLDVDDGGSDVATGVGNLNFGANLTVTDDGGGTVTIDGSGSSDTRTNISNNGSQVLTNTEDINFGTELSVTDDGDGGVTVDSTYSVEAQDDGNALTSSTALINFNDLLEATVANTDEVEVNGVDTVAQTRGTATFSGDGSTTQFTITHGLGYVPRQWFIEEVTEDTGNVSHTTADADTLTVNYDTAPPTGTDNVVLKYATDLKSPDSGGQSTFDGDGVKLQFQIPHGLNETPSEWFVEAATEDSRGIGFTDADSTNIIVNYDTPPASGSGNVVLNYAAFIQDPATFSGDGSQKQFKIPHGLSQTPNDWHVETVTDDASGFFHTTADSTFVTVNYGTAPPSGTGNLKFNLDARL